MNETQDYPTSELPFRDSYGRSCHEVRGNNWKVAGAIVRLPKVAIEQYGKERSYLTNDYRMEHTSDNEASGKVQYHATLREARARFGAADSRKTKFPKQEI